MTQSDSMAFSAQRLSQWSAMLAIAAYPVLVWLPIPIDLALYALTLGGGIAVIVGEPVTGSQHRALPDRLLMLYLAVSLVGIAVAPDQLRALALSSALLPASLLYVLASRYLGDLRQISLLVGALMVAGAGLAGLVLLVALSAAEGAATSTDLVEQVGSPLLIVPNDVLWLALIAPLSLSLALSTRQPLVQALLLVALLLMLTAIVVLQSRSALFGILIGMAVIAWRSGLLHRHPRRLLGASVALLVLIMLADALSGFPLLDKLSTLCFTRGPFWAAAWELFLERPLLGQGAHSFVDLYQSRLPTDPGLFCQQPETRLTPWPHNLFLEILASQGLFGAGLMGAALVWTLLAALRISRADDPQLRALGAALLGAWAVFLFAALVELSLLRLWVVTSCALLLGLTVRLDHLRLKKSIDRYSLFHTNHS